VSRLLILGRSGQLAHALSRAAAGQFDDIVCAGRAEADMAVPGAMATLVKRLGPDAVINAAAYTSVDRAEAEPDLAHRINAVAAGEVATAAKEAGASFVHVSTDYVFGGHAPGPFSEDALPAPVNVYGHSKLAGEKAVLAAHPAAAIVRTSAVFSGRGEDFPSAIWKKAYQGEKLEVVDDQLTTPTFADDLADRLLKLATVKATGIFHCAGQPAVSWFEVARSAVELLNKPVQLTAISSRDMQRPAPRPADCRLSSTRLESLTGFKRPDWHRGLKSALDVWQAAR
jgi:dTDP-4-dehydrorhamnose reductase